VGAAYESYKQAAVWHEVVDEPPLASQEPRIFESLEAPSDLT
jgi:hypothetical protein